MRISDSKTGIRVLRLEFIEGMKCMQINFSFSITIKLGLVVHKQDQFILISFQFIQLIALIVKGYIKVFKTWVIINSFKPLLV